MTKLPKAMSAAAAAIALLGIASGPALAHGTTERGGMAPYMQPAHMGQGYGGSTAAPSYGYGPCPGMKASMGPGMMGYGPMMGHGSMMGYGPMMGHGSMMGHGMWGGGYGHGSAYGKSAIEPDKDLAADDVRARLERSLKWHGNKRLKIGEVKEIDDDTITADIVTQDDSLVERFEVDRHTGQMHRTE